MKDLSMALVMYVNEAFRLPNDKRGGPKELNGSPELFISVCTRSRAALLCVSRYFLGIGLVDQLYHSRLASCGVLLIA